MLHLSTLVIVLSVAVWSCKGSKESTGPQSSQVSHDVQSAQDGNEPEECVAHLNFNGVERPIYKKPILNMGDVRLVNDTLQLHARGSFSTSLIRLCRKGGGCHPLIGRDIVSLSLMAGEYSIIARACSPESCSDPITVASRYQPRYPVSKKTYDNFTKSHRDGRYLYSLEKALSELSGVYVSHWFAQYVKFYDRFTADMPLALTSEKNLCGESNPLIVERERLLGSISREEVDKEILNTSAHPRVPRTQQQRGNSREEESASSEEIQPDGEHRQPESANSANPEETSTSKKREIASKTLWVIGAVALAATGVSTIFAFENLGSAVKDNIRLGTEATKNVELHTFFSDASDRDLGQLLAHAQRITLENEALSKFSSRTIDLQNRFASVVEKNNRDALNGPKNTDELDDYLSDVDNNDDVIRIREDFSDLRAEMAQTYEAESTKKAVDLGKKAPNSPPSGTRAGKVAQLKSRGLLANIKTFKYALGTAATGLAAMILAESLGVAGGPPTWVFSIPEIAHLGTGSITTTVGNALTITVTYPKGIETKEQKMLYLDFHINIGIEKLSQSSTP